MFGATTCTGWNEDPSETLTNEKPAFDYIMKYSPYDNIAPQQYPAMLVLASLNDSQVPYWEGAKLVAKLRTMKTDNNPLLLKVNFGAGHGGGGVESARTPSDALVMDGRRAIC